MYNNISFTVHLLLTVWCNVKDQSEYDLYYNSQNMHSKTKFGVSVCMTYFRMNKVHHMAWVYRK